MALTFRHQYKSVTIELVAPAVADQGDVYAGQYPMDVRQSFPNVTGLNSEVTGNQLIHIRNHVAVPFNESDLTLSACNPYVGRARDGVYMPLRLMGPTQPFADVSYNGGVGYGTALSAGGSSTSIIPNALNSSQTTVQYPRLFVPVTGDSGATNANTFSALPTQFANYFPDTGYDNTGVGVVIFRGLAAGGGGGFTASLMVKVIDGQEVCPRPTTQDRVYAKPAARYEPRALEAYYALLSELPTAFPARYNALGMLLPVLSNLASRLWPAVAAGGRAVLRELVGGAVDEKPKPRAVKAPPPPSAPAVVYRSARAPSVASTKSGIRVRLKTPSRPRGRARRR